MEDNLSNLLKALSWVFLSKKHPPWMYPNINEVSLPHFMNVEKRYTYLTVHSQCFLSMVLVIYQLVLMFVSMILELENTQSQWVQTFKEGMWEQIQHYVQENQYSNSYPYFIIILFFWGCLQEVIQLTEIPHN